MKKILLPVICIATFMFTACEPFGPVTPYNAFSVSEGKLVIFSPGNLQYYPLDNCWQFAAKQKDYIGKGNNYMSSEYNGWIDLYDWRTDTYGSFDDWGNNPIDKDAEGTWRTLTYEEWEYLFSGRTNADLLCGVAQVDGVNGIILLPDCWTCPAGVTFKPGFSSIDKATFYKEHQTLTASQWDKLEAAGAVFLPAAGYSDRVGVHKVQHLGNYWSATKYNNTDAHHFSFRPNQANMESGKKSDSRSVRLVKDVL